MKRPEHLPDYLDPPLDEVVLGVQFAPILGYCSVDNAAIWELYKKDYPKVAEHPMLETKYETFGGANPRPAFQFQIGAPPIGSRLWFITEDEFQLLQFQPDRFLTNWRKRPRPNPYPRFEGIAESYKNNLEKLSDFLATSFDHQMDINQAEISYINIVKVKDFAEVSDWFKIWKVSSLKMEAVSTSFTEIITDSNGKPFARLSHDLQSVYTTDNKEKAFRLSFTYRGKPSENTIDSAMDFFKAGRENIVNRFDEITTNKAHKAWDKIQ